MDESSYRAMGMLENLCPQHTIQLVVVDGDPISKARARFTRHGRPYTPSKTIAGEKHIAAGLSGIKAFRSNVAVACLFYRASRQRIDVDNLLKAVLDAGTRAAIWNDDSQVTAIVGIAEYDRERPRTIICLGEHTSTLTRGDAAMVKCQACDKLFFPGGQRREKAKWCSRECQTYLKEPVPCPRCQKLFKRASGNHKYCSVECRGLAQTAKSISDRLLKTHCEKGHLLDDDNSYVKENGYKRCRLCQAELAAEYRARKEANSNKTPGVDIIIAAEDQETFRSES